MKSRDKPVNMDSLKIEEAQALAKEYLDLLKVWVPRRQLTISEIEDIADSMENIQFGAGVGKAAGATTAVIGGIASVVGIFATGGLATPLIVGGLLGSLAGTATSVGSDILGEQMSNSRMKEAQDQLEREKNLVMKIEEKKEALDEMVEQVSQSTGVSAQQVLSALLMTSVPGYQNGPGYTPSSYEVEKMLQQGVLASVLLGGKAMSVVLVKSINPLSKAMGKTLADVSVKGFSRIAGSMLRGVAAGALLVWDVYLLVKTAVQLNNGSGSAAAKALRDLTKELDNQTKDVQALLDDIRSRAEDVSTLIRDKFRELLVEISEKGEADDTDTAEVRRWIDLYACEEWKKSFMGNLNLETFAMNEAFPLARVVHNLLCPIDQYLQEEDEENKDDEIVITVISHGSINTSVQMPSRFHYMAPSLLSVTLYSPWGAAVDASVVHGICTNTIDINKVRCNGEIYPENPSDFNTLPRDMICVPTVTFEPVEGGKKGHGALMRLLQIHQESTPNGILIAYFSGLDENQLPYPVIPLWLFSAAVSVCSVFVSRRIRIQVAACLAVDQPGSETGFVSCEQYCVVDGTQRPPIAMTNQASVPDDMKLELAVIDELLGYEQEQDLISFDTDDEEECSSSNQRANSFSNREVNIPHDLEINSIFNEKLCSSNYKEENFNNGNEERAYNINEDSNEKENSLNNTEDDIETENFSNDNEDNSEKENLSNDKEDNSEKEYFSSNNEDNSEKENFSNNKEDNSEKENFSNDKEGSSEDENFSNNKEYNSEKENFSSNNEDNSEIENFSNSNKDYSEIENTANNQEDNSEKEYFSRNNEEKVNFSNNTEDVIETENFSNKDTNEKEIFNNKEDNSETENFSNNMEENFSNKIEEILCNKKEENFCQIKEEDFSNNKEDNCEKENFPNTEDDREKENIANNNKEENFSNIVEVNSDEENIANNNEDNSEKENFSNNEDSREKENFSDNEDNREKENFSNIEEVNSDEENIANNNEDNSEKENFSNNEDSREKENFSDNEDNREKENIANNNKEENFSNIEEVNSDEENITNNNEDNSEKGNSISDQRANFSNQESNFSSNQGKPPINQETNPHIDKTVNFQSIPEVSSISSREVNSSSNQETNPSCWNLDHFL